MLHVINIVLRWLCYLRFFSVNVTNIDLNSAVIPYHHQHQPPLITNKYQPENCLLNLSLQGLNIFYYNKGSSLVLKCSAHKVKGNLYKLNDDIKGIHHHPPSSLHHIADESSHLACFSLDLETELIFNENKVGINFHFSDLRISVHESLINLIDAAASSPKATQVSQLTAIPPSSSSSSPSTTINIFESINSLYNFSDIIFTCEKLNLQIINNESNQILSLINDDTELRIGKKSSDDVNIDLIVNNLTTSSLSNESNYDIISLEKFSFQAKVQEESSLILDIFSYL